MTVKCQQCAYENTKGAEKCESCGTMLRSAVEILVIDDDMNDVPKQDVPMSDNIEIDDKLNETSIVLPPEDELDVKATSEVKIDGDDAEKEIIIEVEDETLATAKVSQLDDEDGLLHIGSVRFRGNLLLTEKKTNKVHRIKNEDLDEALIGRLNLKTGFRPQIDFTNVDGKELGVSRRHATINQRGDLIFVTDHNSLNGTYLNGQRLVPEQARVMRDSDTLRIGHVTLIVSFEDVITD